MEDSPYDIGNYVNFDHDLRGKIKKLMPRGNWPKIRKLMGAPPGESDIPLHSNPLCLASIPIENFPDNFDLNSPDGKQTISMMKRQIIKKLNDKYPTAAAFIDAIKDYRDSRTVGKKNPAPDLMRIVTGDYERRSTKKNGQEDEGQDDDGQVVEGREDEGREVEGRRHRASQSVTERREDEGREDEDQEVDGPDDDGPEDEDQDDDGPDDDGPDDEDQDVMEVDLGCPEGSDEEGTASDEEGTASDEEGTASDDDTTSSSSDEGEDEQREDE